MARGPNWQLGGPELNYLVAFDLYLASPRRGRDRTPVGDLKRHTFDELLAVRVKDPAAFLARVPGPPRGRGGGRRAVGG